MIIPAECYIYIARKIFKHNFTQDFRKKYMKKIYEKFNNFLKIELNYKHITKEVYNLKKEKLDKYIEFYEWETFEQ